MRGFSGLRAHGGSPEARSGTKLVMQPGGHGGHGTVDYDPASNIDFRTLQLRFYDRYVKGIHNGFDRYVELAVVPNVRTLQR